MIAGFQMWVRAPETVIIQMLPPPWWRPRSWGDTGSKVDKDTGSAADCWAARAKNGFRGPRGLQLAIRRMLNALIWCLLEYEVKWALGRITTNRASGDDGIPAELFHILNQMLLKCCTQYASKFGKLSSGRRTGKCQFSFQSQRKAMPKSYCTIVLISHTSKVMLKILKLGFNSLWTENFQMFKLDLEKAEEPEIKLPTSIGS